MKGRTMLDLRNIPEPVIERLGAMWESDGTYRRGFDAVDDRGRLVEARAAAVPELRVDGTDGRPQIDGWATVYEYPYDVAGGPPYGWVETIGEGAARKTIAERDDVRLLLNHDGATMARVKNRTLQLVDEPVGIRVATPLGLDMRRTYVADTVYALEDGDLDEMSMAFRVLRQEWNADYTERRILELRLFDVSVVSFPANPATVAQVRSDDPAVDVADETLARSTRLSLDVARLMAAGIRADA